MNASASAPKLVAARMLAVRQDRALRAAGRAGGEQQRSRVVVLAFGDLRQRLAIDRQRAINDDLRRRGRDPHLDLGPGEQDVERHDDCSEAKDAEVGGDVRGRVRKLDRDAVAGSDARFVQRTRDHGRPAVEFAVRDSVALEQERRPLGILGRAFGEERVRDSRAPQPPGIERLRRSHRYFFFVKAGPKSGLT